MERRKLHFDILCNFETSDVVLFYHCFGVSFCTVSLSVCLNDVYLCYVADWPPFNRATHSVNRVFSFLFLFVALVISHFGLVLIA